MQIEFHCHTNRNPMSPSAHDASSSFAEAISLRQYSVYFMCRLSILLSLYWVVQCCNLKWNVTTCSLNLRDRMIALSFRINYFTNIFHVPSMCRSFVNDNIIATLPSHLKRSNNLKSYKTVLTKIEITTRQYDTVHLHTKFKSPHANPFYKFFTKCLRLHEIWTMII